MSLAGCLKTGVLGCASAPFLEQDAARQLYKAGTGKELLLSHSSTLGMSSTMQAGNIANFLDYLTVSKSLGAGYHGAINALSLGSSMTRGQAGTMVFDIGSGANSIVQLPTSPATVP